MDAVSVVKGKIFFILALFIVMVLGHGCGKSAFDKSNEQGKQAIIDATRILLSKNDCSSALSQIEELYGSQYTDNDVRMTIASAYGCSAGINFFRLLGDISLNAPYLAGPPFWSLVAKLFPSVSKTEDRVVEAALLGTEALMATLHYGAIVLPTSLINADGFNPGSMIASDRTTDSNIYMVFMTMAALGGLENRYGVPDSTTHVKTTNLPWTSATASGMTTDGCAYASSAINFSDAVGEVAGSVSGNLATAFEVLDTIVKATVYASCEIGCQACNLNYHCVGCPTELRDRTKCAGTTTDLPSCAAAGIVNMVNAAWIVPVP
ncbi:MAG: hypothetical protein AABZ06_04680 [Bdellovibrionota bacterium]